jgi:hypothetical protein
MKQILFILCAAFIARACDIVEPDGKVHGDTIKFSKTKLFFTAQGGTDSVTSQDTFLELTDIQHNGIWYSFGEIESHNMLNGYVLEIACNQPTPDGRPPSWSIAKVRTTWLTLTRPERKKLIFTVAPNDTDSSRVFGVAVNDGNYNTCITVTQSAE